MWHAIHIWILSTTLSETCNTDECKVWLLSEEGVMSLILYYIWYLPPFKGGYNPKFGKYSIAAWNC